MGILEFLFISAVSFKVAMFLTEQLKKQGKL
jgi:hypothetical protein